MIAQAILAAALGMDFNSALAQAQQQQAALPAAQAELLDQQRGEAVSLAFDACGYGEETPEGEVVADENEAAPPFTVVAALDRSGRVIQTWRQGGDERFASCAEAQIRQNMRFAAPQEPFFASFEFRF